MASGTRIAPWCALVLATALGCSSSADDEPAKAGAGDKSLSAEFMDRKAWADERGLQVRQYDLNRDKRPNVYKFFRVEDGAESLVRKDIDLNNDGTVDVVQMYDEDGALASEQSDLDFDGKMDVIAYMEDEELQRKELDLDYDGKADIVRYYAGGRVERIETDNNGDGRIDTWEYFVNGELDRVGTDNDGDGVVDHWDRRRPAQEEAPEPETATEEPEPEPESEDSSDGESA